MYTKATFTIKKYSLSIKFATVCMEQILNAPIPNFPNHNRHFCMDEFILVLNIALYVSAFKPSRMPADLYFKCVTKK